MIAADGVKKPSMRNVDVDVDGNIDVGVDDDVSVNVDVGVDVDVDVGVDVAHRYISTTRTIFLAKLNRINLPHCCFSKAEKIV